MRCTLGWSVIVGDRATKALKKLPRHIAVNFLGWVDDVETDGLLSVRKLPGYHDEPLKGKWIGYRSIRLSRSYRAIYRIEENVAKVITVVEVNKHEY
ncbi:type II toxin-antitoxin system RelE family toxin [Bdellovibrio sp. HCB274]|uniref:type II toxin-antitoxin system RelE family toxin n=1 Tax=Bdellovibrio sp. HCB274 TaxID=3394361 RepID=UPI0039B49C7D